jgi:hypothetical protein
VQANPVAIEEVRRILLLQLAELPNGYDCGALM